MGVYELLDMNTELAEALRSGDSQSFVNAAVRAPGYEPLISVAHQHAAAGLTTIDEMFSLAGQLKEDGYEETLTLDLDN
jgi:MSHA biogenesis protein MshE